MVLPPRQPGTVGIQQVQRLLRLGEIVEKRPATDPVIRTEVDVPFDGELVIVLHVRETAHGCFPKRIRGARQRFRNLQGGRTEPGGRDVAVRRRLPVSGSRIVTPALTYALKSPCNIASEGTNAV